MNTTNHNIHVQGSYIAGNSKMHMDDLSESDLILVNGGADPTYFVKHTWTLLKLSVEAAFQKGFNDGRAACGCNN